MSLCIGADVIFSLISAAGDASGWMGYMCRCVRGSVPFRARRVVQGGRYVACVTIGCGVPLNGVFVTPFVVSIGIAKGEVVAE